MAPLLPVTSSASSKSTSGTKSFADFGQDRKTGVTATSKNSLKHLKKCEGTRSTPSTQDRMSYVNRAGGFLFYDLSLSLFYCLSLHRLPKMIKCILEECFSVDFFIWRFEDDSDNWSRRISDGEFEDRYVCLGGGCSLSIFSSKEILIVEENIEIA